jgi:hypothetical protein
MDASSDTLQPGDDSSMSPESSSTPEAAMDPPWDAASWNEDAATPDAGDTWDGWVQGFFEKYCVHCHNSSDLKGIDYSYLATAKMYAPLIRCGITPTSGTWDPAWNCGTSFPPKQQFPLPGSTPQPTDAERYRVIAWINAGTP